MGFSILPSWDLLGYAKLCCFNAGILEWYTGFLLIRDSGGDPGMYDVVHLGSGTDLMFRGPKYGKKKNHHLE